MYLQNVDYRPELINGKYLPLTVQFSRTTVDVMSVQNYLFAQPTYYAQGLEKGLGQHALDLLQKVDAIDYQVRQWISWKILTWQSVDRSIRELACLNAKSVYPMTRTLLGDLRNHILRQQWYELLDRLDTVCAHVEEQFDRLQISRDPFFSQHP